VEIAQKNLWLYEPQFKSPRKGPKIVKLVLGRTDEVGSFSYGYDIRSYLLLNHFLRLTCTASLPSHLILLLMR